MRWFWYAPKCWIFALIIGSADKMSITSPCRNSLLSPSYVWDMGTQRKPALSYTQAWLHFDVEKCLWPHEIKVEPFEHNSHSCVWHKQNTAHSTKHKQTNKKQWTLLTVQKTKQNKKNESWWWQHNALRRFFFQGNLVNVEGIINSYKYKSLLEQNIKSSALREQKMLGKAH